MFSFSLALSHNKPLRLAHNVCGKQQLIDMGKLSSSLQFSSDLGIGMSKTHSDDPVLQAADDPDQDQVPDAFLPAWPPSTSKSSLHGKSCDDQLVRKCWPAIRHMMGVSCWTYDKITTTTCRLMNKKAREVE